MSEASMTFDEWEALAKERRLSVHARLRNAEAELRRLSEENEKLRKHLHRALTTDEFDRFHGTEVPNHWCGFGMGLASCELHEWWVSAAEACGLLDEMALEQS